jgi:phosphopantetheinyl transferase (holo-ACP synthase)
MTSLKRNAERGRSLPTSAVLKSWASVVNNIEPYRQLFGNNIAVINNNPSDADKTFDSEEVQKLFPMPKGKEKSPEELAKSKAEKEAVNKQIQDLLQQEPEFDSMETAKAKINEFTR